MSERQVEISENTRVIRFEVMGNLKLTGTDEAMGPIRLKDGGAEEELDIAQSGNTLTISAGSDCEAWLPPGIPVTVKQVGGDLKVRDLQADLVIEEAHGNAKLSEGQNVIIENVHGDLKAEALSALTVHGTAHGNVRLVDVRAAELGNVMGDLRASDLDRLRAHSTAGNLTAKDVQGAVEIDQVGGDAVLRDIDGLVTIQRVEGNLVAQNVLGGAKLSQVGGDLLLTGELGSGHTYQCKAGGNAVLRLAEDTGAHIVLRAAGHVTSSLRLAEEERTAHSLSGRIGESGPEITIEAGGDAVLGREHGSVWDWGEFEGEFEILGAHLGEAISRQVQESLRAVDMEAISRKANQEIERAMERLRTKLETVDWERMGSEAQRAVERAMSQMQRELDRLSEKAARQQEKMARMAERQAERARRYTDRAGRRPHQAHVYMGSWGSPEPQPRRSYDEERLAILKMVEQGQITPEEAELLLDALV